MNRQAPARRMIGRLPWAYSLGAGLAVAAAVFVMTAIPNRNILAATYTWAQTSWAGGVTANIAVHPGNRTGWTEYAAKDATVSATDGGVTLVAQPATLTQTSDTDFGAGTNSNTVVAGTGAGATVTLATSTVWPPTVSTFTLAHARNSDQYCPSGTPPACQDRIAYDSGTNSIWSTSVNSLGASPDVFKFPIDGSTPTSINLSSSAGYFPWSIVYDSVTPAIWVVAGSTELKKLNPTDGSTLATYNVLNSWKPASPLYFDASRQRIWGLRSNGNFGYISTVDGSISTCYVAGFQDVFVDPTFTYAYGHTQQCPYECEEYHRKIDLNSCTAVTGSVLTNIWPLEYTYDTVTNSLWLLEVGGSNIAKIRASDLSVLPDSIPAASYRSIVFDSTQQVLWLTRLDGDNTISILKVDPSTAAVTATYNIPSSNFWLPTNSIYDPNSGSVYLGTHTGSGPIVARMLMVGYASAGTFTSSIMNTNGSTVWNNGSWTGSAPTNTTMTMRVRSSNSGTMSGAPDFATCDTITSGNDISTNNCVTDGHRYIQYQASLATSDSSKTPSLNDVSLGYNAFTSGTLTSSIFDTATAENVMGNIGWTTSGTGTVRYQIRTASTSGGIAGATWLGPTGAGDYYTTAAGTNINPQQRDGLNDRYYQYRAELIATDGGLTPTVTATNISYVVNAPPEFESLPTASQHADGSVDISYSVRDPDGTSGSNTPNLITPSFEYSLDNGNSWHAITTGLSAGATNNKSVAEVNYTTYALRWDAKAQIDGSYAAQAKIKVIANDNEAANNTTSSVSGAFALDVKDPAGGSPAITVDATTTPATIGLSATDDSSLEMCVTLNNTETNCTAYGVATTITLATNPDTVYVIYRDAFGNTTSASAVTPQSPSNLIIRDISNVGSGEYQLFLTWGATSVPAPDFSQYRIYHSDDGVTYAPLTTIADRTINYFFHQSLVADSEHWYKVAVATNDGNVSTLSSMIRGVANGQGGGTDTVAPTISAVATTSITTQSAIITWDTDELSNSTIGYSTTPADFSTEVGVATMADTVAGLGVHTVVINDLQPDTTYYYQVKSSDPSGNEGVDTNGGDGYSFRTLAGPAITNVTTTDIDNVSATITWKTNIPADSTVRYSTTLPFSSPLAVTSEDEVTDHAIRLTDLTRGTTYYFEVVSGVANDPNGGSYYSFTTTDDSTPPVISGLTVTPVTDTQAVIRWTTNERATAAVDFGINSGDYTSNSPVDDSLNVLHAVTLTGLAPLTTYYYVVQAVDASGNAATSTEATFTTTDTLVTEAEARAREEAARGSEHLTAPVVSGISVGSITSTSANVSWTTDELANSFVRFGVSDATSIIYGNWVYATAHTIALTGLTPRTTYQYNVISADQAGNITESSIATFTTLAATATELEELIVDTIDTYGSDVPTPVISGQPKVDVASTKATISWTTDKEANSLVGYAPDGLYQAGGDKYVQVVGDPDGYKTAHVVTIENLTPDTLYHFQARSKTKASGVSVSPDYTFRTEKRTFEIENYTIDQIDDETAAFRWTTTEPGTSTVTIIPYRNNVRALDELKTVTETTQTIIHQIQLENLEPSVRYQVELISTNAAGARTSKVVDAFSTVTTPAPPLITRIQVDSALSTGENIKVQTIVSWTTDKPSTSQVRWREGVGQADDELPNATALDGAYTKRHLVVLTTFKPGSVYQLRVESTDSNGQTTLSKPLTILTPQQEQTVIEVIMGAVNQAFGWTRLFRR